MKESEKIDKYWGLARELKKMWYMRAAVIVNVFGALGMVSKALEKRLRELEIGRRIKILQTTTLLKSVRTFRSELET